jgi:hypothetical protein
VRCTLPFSPEKGVEATQVQNRRRLSARLDDAVPPRDLSSTVTIRTLLHVLASRSDVAADFAQPGDAHATCLANAALCAERGDRFLAMVWSALGELLRNPTSGKNGQQLVYSRHSLPERLLDDMCVTFESLRGAD